MRDGDQQPTVRGIQTYFKRVSCHYTAAGRGALEDRLDCTSSVLAGSTSADQDRLAGRRRFADPLCEKPRGGLG